MFRSFCFQFSLLACPRLRDSRARGIEKARTRRKTGGNWGEGGGFLFTFSRPAPIFAHPTLSRLPHSFAPSPLTESLEQAIPTV